MPTSACSRRDSRRAATARRIRWAALELTRDKSFDGWTMDELAESADVSRRTLFNYFDSKADVVLGPEHEIDTAAMDDFVAGGPTGHLFDDLAHFAIQHLGAKAGDLEIERFTGQVIHDDPRLISLVHQRFTAIASEAADLILQREGSDFGVGRARLTLEMLVAIFGNVLLFADLDTGRPFPELVQDAIEQARETLAR